MFSFVTWFFKSHLLKIGLSFLLLHILGFFIFSGYYFSNICVLCILSHFLDFFFFFTFLMLSFGEQNFYFKEVIYVNLFIINALCVLFVLFVLFNLAYPGVLKIFPSMFLEKIGCI